MNIELICLKILHNASMQRTSKNLQHLFRMTKQSYSGEVRIFRLSSTFVCQTIMYYYYYRARQTSRSVHYLNYSKIRLVVAPYCWLVALYDANSFQRMRQLPSCNNYHCSRASEVPRTNCFYWPTTFVFTCCQPLHVSTYRIELSYIWLYCFPSRSFHFYHIVKSIYLLLP